MDNSSLKREKRAESLEMWISGKTGMAVVGNVDDKGTVLTLSLPDVNL